MRVQSLSRFGMEIERHFCIIFIRYFFGPIFFFFSFFSAIWSAMLFASVLIHCELNALGA